MTRPERIPVPAWLVLNVMADAIIDRKWGHFDPSTGESPEVWVQAKEGDFTGTRDEMVDGLRAIEERGWICLDWDAEPPEPKIIRAEEIVGEQEPS